MAVSVAGAFVVDDRPVFIGLDLAWSSRNRTGGAVIQDGRLVAATGGLGSDAEIQRFVADHLPASAAAVVAVDAPLCVPNAEGRRRCDHEVSLAWGAYEAGAYPANRRLLAVDGIVRGESLAAALAADYGFAQAAPLPLRGEGRYVCEVFPHPAHVALFGLPRDVQVTSASLVRGADDAAAEFARYQQLLAGLKLADPSLEGLEPWTSIDPGTLRWRARQELEETLDAVTCAYVAWYAWWHGPERQRVFGTIPEGHILTPLPPPGATVPPATRRSMMSQNPAPTPELPPDTLNARIGVLTRREGGGAHAGAADRGIGRRVSLMTEVERVARADGRWLLHLDTQTGSDAEGMYRALGWRELGVMPWHSLSVDGVPTAATYFWKDLRAVC